MKRLAMVYPMAHTLDKKKPDRVAYDFDEFAALFGRDRTWTCRQVKAGRIKAITGFGKMMISAAEAERIAKGKEFSK